MGVELLEIASGQMHEHRNVDVVLSKSLGVFGHAELFEVNTRNIVRLHQARAGLTPG